MEGEIAQEPPTSDMRRFHMYHTSQYMRKIQKVTGASSRARPPTCLLIGMLGMCALIYVCMPSHHAAGVYSEGRMGTVMLGRFWSWR